jgi:hypothetical protein
MAYFCLLHSTDIIQKATSTPPTPLIATTNALNETSPYLYGHATPHTTNAKSTPQGLQPPKTKLILVLLVHPFVKFPTGFKTLNLPAILVAFQNMHLGIVDLHSLQILCSI